jgi:drug/metabolite transporter (DMT)-like permease
MEAKLTPGTGIVILIVVASCFAANHLSARIAFDHGANVAFAVAVRASSTALFLFFVLKVLKIPFTLPAGTRGWALLAGVLIAVQSYCLYSAVAIIPPALALLVFQTSPMLYVLITWAAGKQQPRAVALAPMLLALAGLALALDIRTDQIGARWSEIGVGVSWAFASGVSMAFVYFLNGNALAAIDGRLRTFVMTAVTAAIVIVAAGSAGAMRLPADAIGAAGTGQPHHLLLHGDDRAFRGAAARAAGRDRGAQFRAHCAARPDLGVPRSARERAADHRRVPHRRRHRLAERHEEVMPVRWPVNARDAKPMTRQQRQPLRRKR